MKTITPMLPEIAAQLCEQKHLLRKFESALIAADLDALSEPCPKIDDAFIWPRAWRRVAHLKQELSGDVKIFFWQRGLVMAIILGKRLAATFY